MVAPTRNGVGELVLMVALLSVCELHEFHSLGLAHVTRAHHIPHSNPALLSVCELHEFHLLGW